MEEKQMPETPDFATFDIGEVLAGRGYPETEVAVYMDEQSGYAVNLINEELTRLSGLGLVEEYAELEAKFNTMLADLNGSRYVFTLKGTPRKVKADIVRSVLAEYPEKKDFLGRVEDNPEREEKYANLLWASHVARITAPNGAVSVPTYDNIVQFRDYAPIAAIEAIETGITELTSGAKAGFEAAARNTDFLSEPSQEG